MLFCHVITQGSTRRSASKYFRLLGPQGLCGNDAPPRCSSRSSSNQAAPREPVFQRNFILKIGAGLDSVHGPEVLPPIRTVVALPSVPHGFEHRPGC